MGYLPHPQLPSRSHRSAIQWSASEAVFQRSRHLALSCRVIAGNQPATVAIQA